MAILSADQSLCPKIISKGIWPAGLALIPIRAGTVCCGSIPELFYKEENKLPLCVS